jgi:hypothetical protein
MAPPEHAIVKNEFNSIAKQQRRKFPQIPPPGILENKVSENP